MDDFGSLTLRYNFFQVGAHIPYYIVKKTIDHPLLENNYSIVEGLPYLMTMLGKSHNSHTLQWEASKPPRYHYGGYISPTLR